MALDFDRFKSVFLKYAESFVSNSTKEKKHIRLKIDHSLRVLENAKVIVANTSCSEKTAESAMLASLFHDIGRFTQYQRYKTFNDRKSVNHGHLGVQVLKQSGIHHHLPKSYRQDIASAIALHNRNAIPSHVSEPLRTICNIVRDSDKIDIFKVMLNHFSSGYPDSTVALEAIPHATKYTQRMFDNVWAGKPCLYSDIYWTNDFKLILASWTHQLNFPVSYRLFYDSGLFDQLFGLLPQTKEFNELKDKLRTLIGGKKEEFGAGTAFDCN